MDGKKKEKEPKEKDAKDPGKEKEKEVSIVILPPLGVSYYVFTMKNVCLSIVMIKEEIENN